MKHPLPVAVGHVALPELPPWPAFQYFAHSAGPCERALAFHADRQTVTPGDLAHARHRDTGCWNCQDNDKCHAALVEEAEQLRAGYGALQSGLYLLRRPFLQPDLFPEHEATPEKRLADLLAALEKLSAKAGRAVRGPS